MKTITFITLTFILIIITGCKPNNNNEQLSPKALKDSGISSVVIKTEVLLEKDNEQTKSVKTNITQKLQKSADYKKIEQYMAKEKTKKKLSDYAAYMVGKSPYQDSVKMSRVKFMSLTGKPIPGRVLSDEDIENLCNNNYENISKELYILIATSFGYSSRPALQGTVEDGTAIIKNLMENGTPEVSTQAKLLLAEFTAQTTGLQNESIKLFKEGIEELEKQGADVDKIIESEKEKVATYIYNDDLESADAAAEELLEKYSNNKQAKVLWNNVLELYWLRIMGWKDENPEHARELCKQGLEINNGYAVKKGDPWDFKSEYERLSKK